jgi:hypothetical protein
MPQRRLRVVKWLSTTPALGVCTLCSREFKVPMSALRRTADAQANLQEQFDRHKCQPDDSSQAAARVRFLCFTSQHCSSTQQYPWGLGSK